MNRRFRLGPPKQRLPQISGSRICPMRQKQAGYDRPVLVYPILTRNTVDDLVMDRLSTKKSVQEVLLEAMKRRKK